MKHLTLLLLFLVLATSCDNKIAKPDDLIPEDKMADILTDLTLINAGQSINKKIMLENGILPEAYIYQKHGIDSLQFALSNNYYAHHIKKYERIYDKLKANLNAKKVAYKKIEAEEKKEKKTQDSLRKIRKRTQKDSLNYKVDPKDMPPTEKKPKGLLKTTDSLPE